MVIEIGHKEEIKFPQLSAEQLAGIFEEIARPVLSGLVDQVDLFSGEMDELIDTTKVGKVSVHTYKNSLFSVNGMDLFKATSIFAAKYGSNLNEQSEPKKFKRKREGREVIVREWWHSTDKPWLFLVLSQESPTENPENYDGRRAYSLRKVKRSPKKT